MPEFEAAELRRREATKAFIRYAFMFAVLIATFVVFTVYTVHAAQVRRSDTAAIRVEYCTQLERLKTVNRTEVKDAKRHYKRNLALLGIKDTRALHKIAADAWKEKLRLNAPKKCPYKP